MSNVNGIIAGEELKQLVKEGVITGLISEDQINAASIDVTLGSVILVESGKGMPPLISLANRDAVAFEEHNIEGGNFILAPGQFILASTNEIFNLPNDISAQYIVKSSMARMGLNHLHAGWCDAGWNGSVLTMELHNVTSRQQIILDHNVKIGQMVFHRHASVSEEQSYATKGAYNGNKQTTATQTEKAKQETKKAAGGTEEKVSSKQAALDKAKAAAMAKKGK